MKLINVYPPLTGWWPFRIREYDPAIIRVLYDLLAERAPEQSISHRSMPAWRQHVDFVVSEPYTAWYVIEEHAELVGAVYLSKLDEIGISVFRSHRGRGYACDAIHLLMKAHPRDRYLANINPANEASASLFTSLGFKLAQHTYAKEE